jgi:GNAT superfamily N-acetyltransferase
MHKITEVDGQKCADEIQRFNALFPDDFYPMKPRHFANGFWWLVHDDIKLIGFAGMVPFEPFPNVGYWKRVAVLKEYRGAGIPQELMQLSEERARASTDWTHMVSECSLDNVSSANNLIKGGYLLARAERPWEKETLFWIKRL